jgi:putative tryptophan/tyrosine transport system substrate-binding protein
VISELKRGDIDLAVSSGPATRAMTAVTDVPVLFALSGDPVELGIVSTRLTPDVLIACSRHQQSLSAKRMEQYCG